MSLHPGLYKLAFHSSYGTDYGVAVLGDNGRVRGGDSGMAYLGTYRQDGDVLSMDLTVTQHRHVPGVVSVLGYNHIAVELEGVAAESSAELQGTSRQAPGVRMAVRLSHIADRRAEYHRADNVWKRQLLSARGFGCGETTQISKCDDTLPRGVSGQQCWPRQKLTE